MNNHRFYRNRVKECTLQISKDIVQPAMLVMFIPESSEQLLSFPVKSPIKGPHIRNFEVCVFDRGYFMACLKKFLI